MSRVYEALKQMEKEQGLVGTVPMVPAAEPLSDPAFEKPADDNLLSNKLEIVPASRLVALSDPKGLGAEKFRALATRLIHLQRQREFKSLQVTSSVISEGKSLLATNLAITLAEHCHAKVLLLEGDLHRPGIARLLGVKEPPGIIDWWSDESKDICQFLCQLNEMSVWFLSAGVGQEQPSHILQSNRLSESFNRLLGLFDWVVVDSTPMLPVADANLWSRLVDGTLLVVREGVASVNALKKGLASLDGLKLVGTVLNGASESGRSSYSGYYYGAEQKKQRKVAS